MLNALGCTANALKRAGAPPADLRPAFDPAARQQRQVMELEDYTQRLMRESERTRASFFWDKIQVSSVRRLGDLLRPFQTDPLGGGHWPFALPDPAGQSPHTPLGAAPRCPAARRPA